MRDGVLAGHLHDVERADEVGVDVGARVLQAVAHARLRREVDDDLRAERPRDRGEAIAVLQHQHVTRETGVRSSCA